MNDGNKEEMYVFRFGTSKKTVQLTQQQLDDIPYLGNLINHRHFFAFVPNENGEYVLNARIRYNWFMPIFQYITTGHPSVLFTKLSEEAYVCSMLQLYEYLCINPIAVPLFKGQHLVRVNSKEIVKKNFRVEYMRAKNLLEVRDTAAQFVIALNKNEYDLHDFDTRCSIFSLIIIILSHPNIFSFRLCHHTLILSKKVCFSLFSYSQQRQLEQMEQSVQSIKPHFCDYAIDDEEPLPRNFQNAFAWKDVYVSIEENNASHHRPIRNKAFTDIYKSLILDYEIGIEWPLFNDHLYLMIPSVYRRISWLSQFPYLEVSYAYTLLLSLISELVLILN